MNEIVKAKSDGGVSPIIIGSESKQDYMQHKATVLVDLDAVGALEKCVTTYCASFRRG